MKNILMPLVLCILSTSVLAVTKPNANENMLNFLNYYQSLNAINSKTTDTDKDDNQETTQDSKDDMVKENLTITYEYMESKG